MEKRKRYVTKNHSSTFSKPRVKPDFEEIKNRDSNPPVQNSPISVISYGSGMHHEKDESKIKDQEKIKSGTNLGGGNFGATTKKKTNNGTSHGKRKKRKYVVGKKKKILSKRQELDAVTVLLNKKDDYSVSFTLPERQKRLKITRPRSVISKHRSERSVKTENSIDREKTANLIQDNDQGNIFGTKTKVYPSYGKRTLVDGEKSVTLSLHSNQSANQASDSKTNFTLNSDNSLIIEKKQKVYNFETDTDPGSLVSENFSSVSSYGNDIIEKKDETYCEGKKLVLEKKSEKGTKPDLESIKLEKKLCKTINSQKNEIKNLKKQLVDLIGYINIRQYALVDKKLFYDLRNMFPNVVKQKMNKTEEVDLFFGKKKQHEIIDYSGQMFFRNSSNKHPKY